MKNIKRIYAGIFKWVPVSAIFTVLNYLSAALVPAVITVVSVGLFDNAARVLSGEAVTNQLYLYGFLYLGAYFVNDLLFYSFSIAVN